MKFEEQGCGHHVHDGTPKIYDYCPVWLHLIFVQNARDNGLCGKWYLKVVLLKDRCRNSVLFQNPNWGFLTVWSWELWLSGQCPGSAATGQRVGGRGTWEQARRLLRKFLLQRLRESEPNIVCFLVWVKQAYQESILGYILLWRNTQRCQVAGGAERRGSRRLKFQRWWKSDGGRNRQFDISRCFASLSDSICFRPSRKLFKSRTLMKWVRMTKTNLPLR